MPQKDLTYFDLGGTKCVHPRASNHGYAYECTHTIRTMKKKKLYVWSGSIW
jgi:hypothetical protein